MASIVQCVFASGSSASITPTVGNSLVVFSFVSAVGGSWGTPSDGHNTYTARGIPLNQAALFGNWFDSLAITTGGALTVTTGRSGGSVSGSALYVFEIHPSGTLSYDTGNGAVGATGAPTTASFTPAGAGELILAAASALTASFTNFTAGTGFTLQRTDGWGLGGATDGAGCEFVLSGAAGAQTASMNPSQSVAWAIQALAYIDTVTPGAVPPQLMRRGMS
jgi:hypothetical protein